MHAYTSQAIDVSRFHAAIILALQKNMRKWK